MTPPLSTAAPCDSDVHGRWWRAPSAGCTKPYDPGGAPQSVLYETHASTLCTFVVKERSFTSSELEMYRGSDSSHARGTCANTKSRTLHRFIGAARGDAAAAGLEWVGRNGRMGRPNARCSGWQRAPRRRRPYRRAGRMSSSPQARARK
eukprot:scaffold18540_cov144-Isochrysis_galbana.AAC.1